MNDLRAPTIELADGDVLEVGFGTGLNLSCNPPTVKSVTGVDPLEGALDRVDERVAACCGFLESVRPGIIELFPSGTRWINDR